MLAARSYSSLYITISFLPEKSRKFVAAVNLVNYIFKNRKYRIEMKN